MKRHVLFAFSGVLFCAVACSHVQAGSPPVGEMSCPSHDDPQCVAASTGMVTLDPPPAVERGPRLEDDANSGRASEIVGHCELIVAGKPRPCTGVTLRVRRDGEERVASVSGFDFKFENLTRDHYRLEATHPRYGLVTPQKDDVSPGQTLKLTLRAKSR